MGALNTLIQMIKNDIVIYDRLTYLSAKVDDLGEDVQNIERRVIRLETIVEIGEKQRFFAKETA